MANHSQLVRCDPLKAIACRSKLYRSANASAKDLGLNVKTIRLIENGTAVRLSKVQQYAERLGVSIEKLLRDYIEPNENKFRIVASPTNSELFGFPIFSGLWTEPTLKKALAHPCTNDTVLKLIRNGGVRGFDQLIVQHRFNSNPVWLLAEGTVSSIELAEELKKIKEQIDKAIHQNSNSLEDLIATIELRCDLEVALLSLSKTCEYHILGVNIKTEYEESKDINNENYESVPVEITIPVFFVAPKAVREIYFEYESASSHNRQNSQWDQDDGDEDDGDEDLNQPF